MTEFDNLRTLHAATTPGEWAVLPPDRHESWPGVVEADGGKWIVADWGAWMGQEQMGADAAFIVAAHNKLPALLARLDEVTAERDAQAVANETARNLLVASFQTAWGEDAPLGKQLSHEAVEALSQVSIASVLAAHDAKVRAEALREAADAEDLPYLTIHPSGSPILALPYAARGESVELADWLGARADKEENR